jgi:hypothetical protein
MQMTDFTFSQLNLTPISSNLWKLTNDLNICVNMPAKKGYRFLLKKDFATNLRSGSDLISPIIPRNGDEGRTLSYILHDALYTCHYFSRLQADELLKAMLTECDNCTRAIIAGENDKRQIKLLKSQLLGSFKIWAIYNAVRLFGQGAYDEKILPPYEGNEKRFFMEVL